MREGASPPHPSDLTHLKPADTTGCICLGGTVAATGAGIWLSAEGTAAAWIAGQSLLAASLVEWFVLLHECGHDTLFRTRTLHRFAGQLAGLFSLIPFECWRRIHFRHHKWTGWQDVDPTTTSLAPRERGRLERAVVNLCWKYWIPLFATMYRLENFWNVPRVLRLFRSEPRAQTRLLANLAAQAAVYAIVVLAVGPVALARIFGLALLLAFIAEDVLLLSQHTHVPMGLSRGKLVEPHSAIAQEPFTRSLRLPAWLSRLWLHFDAHELHHMYPFVPGYRLTEIPYSTANQVSWRRWVPAARALPGEVFLFRNRIESGSDV